jgi:hypothetical protein
MENLFSSQWMESFKNQWNTEPGLADALAAIDFNSVIGYGFAGEAQPRGVLVIEKGHAVSGGSFQGQTLNWDLRAKPEQWVKWFQDPPGITGLGLAFTTGKIKFQVGDYKAMLKDPRMAGPFIKSFSVMGRA